MKRVWALVLVVVVILGIIFIPKMLNEGDDMVKFKTLDENKIPEKIENILPTYKMEERALACRVDDEIYVILTRGEKKTAGYSVTIDKIEKVNENGEVSLIVYAKYKDPKIDELVSQVITYPFTVVKTELKELPHRITFKTEYIE